MTDPAHTRSYWKELSPGLSILITSPPAVRSLAEEHDVSHIQHSTYSARGARSQSDPSSTAGQALLKEEPGAP